MKIELQDVTFREDDPLIKEKTQVWNKYKQTNLKSTVDGIDLESASQLLSILRFIYFKDRENIVNDEGRPYVRYSKDWKVQMTNSAIERPVSMMNELKTMTVIANLCYTRLYEYPRTLQGDLLALKDTTISENARKALTIVIQEKKALINLIR